MRAISCCGSNPERLNELLADPMVQMLMRADHITEEQIRALTGAISSGAGEAKDEGPGAIGALEEYRPGVGIVLLNADNEVLVGRRRGSQGLAVAVAARRDRGGGGPPRGRSARNEGGDQNGQRRHPRRKPGLTL